MEDYSEPEIKEKVQEAIRTLFKNDSFLLEREVHERCVTHKLAEYLQQLFPDYHVDCEYNKHKDATKKLLRILKGEKIEKVYPDIVIHTRGTDKNNLIVIEAKLKNKIDENDQIKLELFTNKEESKQSHGTPYDYQYGLSISFDKTNTPYMRWFKNGSAQ